MALYRLAKPVNLDGTKRMPGELVELSQRRADWLADQGAIARPGQDGVVRAALLSPRPAGQMVKRKCCGR